MEGAIERRYRDTNLTDEIKEEKRRTNLLRHIS